MITNNIKRNWASKAYVLSAFLFCCGFVQAQDFTEDEPDSVGIYNYLIPGTDRTIKRTLSTSAVSAVTGLSLIQI